LQVETTTASRADPLGEARAARPQAADWKSIRLAQLDRRGAMTDADQCSSRIGQRKWTSRRSS
jgi:hypothetical protein